MIYSRRALQNASDKVHATVEFVPPQNVRRVTEHILAEAERAFNRSKTKEEKLITIFRLYRALISTHVFVDGNGRAIRLYISALLLKSGFPIKFFPRLPEYETPTSVLLKEYIAGNHLDL